MTDKNKLKWLYGIVLVFLLANAISFVNDWYGFLLIPIVLIIFILFIYAFDTLLLVVVFFTPLSINLDNFYNGLGIAIPTEPLMLGLTVLFFIKLIHEQNYDKAILKHPITIAILINLVWMIVTTITSEDIIVSIKHTVARIWFVVCFYFIGVYLFKKYKNIKLFLWLYIIPLTGIIFYTIINHARYNFAEKPGHWVMTPFFNDHTAYGAILAFFIPILIYFSFADITQKKYRIVSILLLILYFIALVLSFCRAAWLGIIVAICIYIVIQFKINYKWVVLGIIVGLGMIIAYQSDIISTMHDNKQQSSGNIIQHAQSISNISTDASNLERINRWESAFRMFWERPVFGWGPGTYQFYYGPFQLSQNKTIISTNAGDMGTAHSEYFGPLSESGLIGMLSVLAIVINVFITSIKLLKSKSEKHIKRLVIFVFLGLVTYLVHGSLNNFLDSDKAAVPFWGFIAIIVAIDLFHDNKNQVI